MTTKSVHLSLARQIKRHTGLNLRVNGNARSLPLFSRSDVASFDALHYRSFQV